MKNKPIGYTRGGRAIWPVAGAGPTVEELEEQRATVTQEATALLEAGELNEEQSGTLRTLDTRYNELTESIEATRESEGLADRFAQRRTEEDTRRAAQRPPLYGGGPGPGSQGQGFNIDDVLTPGERFMRSDAFKSWIQKFPSGGPTSQMQAWSDAEPMGIYRDLLGMAGATETLRSRILTPATMRALLTSNDASAGLLVQPDFRGLLEPGQIRPLSVRQLITVIPVTTDAITYIKENSRVSGAAPVAEATGMGAAVTGATSNMSNVAVGGLKPEGGLTFVSVTDTIKTIAEWVPATNRILSDAPFLRGYIDQYLTDDLALELEDQIVAGPGGGENFVGILNTVGIQTAGPPAGVVNEFDLIRRAKRQVRIGGRTNATAVLMNPEDAERQDQIKFGGASPTAYIGGGPFGGGNPDSIWGIPRIESEGIPLGTALVGDFRRAVLFDRENTTISVGTAMDDFLRNIVRVLAELRAGFAVLRPAAFVAVDLIP